MAPQTLSIRKTQRDVKHLSLFLLIRRRRRTSLHNITLIPAKFDIARFLPRRFKMPIIRLTTTTPCSGDFLPDGRNDTRRKVGPTIWVILVRPPGWIQDDKLSVSPERSEYFSTAADYSATWSVGMWVGIVTHMFSPCVFCWPHN
jgi:hypothetical protein